MPCIRTGAHIFIEPYNEYAICDAFEVEPRLSQKQWRELYQRYGTPPFDGLYYFRITGRERSPIRDYLHFTIHEYDNWFDKDTRASCLITNHATYHGYEGVKV